MSRGQQHAGRRKRRPVAIPQERPPAPPSAARFEAIMETRHLEKHEHSISVHEGSLFPAASEVERFEILMPGATKRIFDRVDTQAEHRMSIQLMFAKGDERRLDRGLNIAGVLSGGSIIAGVLLAVLGHEWPAVVIGGPAGIAALVTALTKSRFTK